MTHKPRILALPLVLSVLLVTIFLRSPCTAQAAESTVPDTVEAVLDTLLQDGKANTPGASALTPLLDFVTQSGLDSQSVRPKKRPQGAGCFARTSLAIPFAELLRYCYDPQIPGEALYPSVLRRHRWLPQSQIVRDNVKLWEQAKKLQDGAEPLLFRGMEQEEITPDTFSGCFYTYTLDRLLLLLRHKGVDMLVSVAQQTGPSTVGCIGAVVGEDTQWNYVYSKKVGSDLALAKWAETYMYDAGTVTVLYQQGEKNTGMAFFKYVRAGWNNINMVKPKHIASGIQRFLHGFKTVIESPARPSPDELAAKARELAQMDENTLRQKMLPYAQALSAYADKKPLSASPFKELVQDNQYPQSLTKDELISELIKQFTRQRLGKSPLPGTQG